MYKLTVWRMERQDSYENPEIGIQWRVHFR